jgi:hypothetical protein
MTIRAWWTKNMALRTTPLLQTPYPDGNEKPNVPLVMQRSLVAAERHSIVPVASNSDRDSLLTGANAPFKGMVTYNATTDSFDYFNGSAWVPINHHINMPASAGTIISPNVIVRPGQTYEASITITMTKQALIYFVVAMAGEIWATSTTYQWFFMTTTVNGAQRPLWARHTFARPASAQAGYVSMCVPDRINMPGPTAPATTIAQRVGAVMSCGTVASNIQCQIQMVMIQAFQLSAEAAPPGSSAGYGPW